MSFNILANELVVWQCKEPKFSADADMQQLEELINALDLVDKAKAIKLSSAKLVKSLQLSDNEMLLVQVPGDGRCN